MYVSFKNEGEKKFMYSKCLPASVSQLKACGWTETTTTKKKQFFQVGHRWMGLWVQNRLSTKSHTHAGIPVTLYWVSLLF